MEREARSNNCFAIYLPPKSQGTSDGGQEIFNKYLSHAMPRDRILNWYRCVLYLIFNSLQDLRLNACLGRLIILL